MCRWQWEAVLASWIRVVSKQLDIAPQVSVFAMHEDGPVLTDPARALQHMRFVRRARSLEHEPAWALTDAPAPWARLPPPLVVMVAMYVAAEELSDVVAMAGVCSTWRACVVEAPLWAPAVVQLQHYQDTLVLRSAHLRSARALERRQRWYARCPCLLWLPYSPAFEVRSVLYGLPGVMVLAALALVAALVPMRGGGSAARWAVVASTAALAVAWLLFLLWRAAVRVHRPGSFAVFHHRMVYVVVYTSSLALAAALAAVASGAVLVAEAGADEAALGVGGACIACGALVTWGVLGANSERHSRRNCFLVWCCRPLDYA